MGHWIFKSPIIWAGKKIYDAITESNSSSSTSSSSNSTIKSAKTKRTKARKKAIRKLLLAHEEKMLLKLGMSTPQDGSIKLYQEEGLYKLNFKLLNKETNKLEMAKDILMDSHDRKRKASTSNIHLHDSEEILSKMIKNALNDFGELDGIDSFNDYIKSDDSFLKALKKVK